MSFLLHTDLVDNIRKQSPLIHCITNYVTAGAVANMILATGASAVMADEPHEVEEMTSLADALVLNLGTLNAAKVPAILAAGCRAAELGHPVVYDPVGCGATTYRTEVARQVLDEVPCTVIRGNVTEIRALFAARACKPDTSERTPGVDAGMRDSITEEHVHEFAGEAASYAKQSGAIVVMTGAIDVVAGCGEKEEIYLIRNGVPYLAHITGAGCMLDGVIAVYCAANRKNAACTLTQAVALAVAAEGLCGEQAYQQVLDHHAGTGSMSIYLLDAMSNMTSKLLAQGIKLDKF